VPGDRVRRGRVPRSCLADSGDGGDDGDVHGLVGGPGVVGAAVPTGPGYSILLVLHVACAVISLGTVTTTGVQAWRARSGPAGPTAEGVRRYFRPGVNWAARALYGVPVFGFVLLGVSRGTFFVGDTFVVVGLGLWLTAAVGAEAVVWPGERRVQALVTERWGDPAAEALLERECRRLAAGAALVATVLVAAFVIMVGKP